MTDRKKEKPIFATCSRCAHESPSKYEFKHHVCRERNQ